MTKTTAIILSVLFVSSFGFSQITITNQHKDYIITHEGDTINGEIRYGNHLFGSRLNKIVLIDEANLKHKYKADEIIGFTNDNVYYASVVIDGYRYFAREAVRGIINLYYFEYAFAQNYNNARISEADDLGVKGKIVSVYLERAGNMDRIFKKKFEQNVFPFMGDNDLLMDRIRTGNYTFDEMETIVSDYNEWAVTR